MLKSSSVDYSYDSYDGSEDSDYYYSDSLSDESAQPQSLRYDSPILTIQTGTILNATSPDFTSDKCSITLYDKTLLRGQTVTLVSPNNSAVPDLSAFSFDNKLTSFEAVSYTHLTLPTKA